MDILDLKKRLSENPEEIVEILEFYGYSKMRIHNTEIRCARDDDGSGNSIRIRLDEKLYFSDFVTQDKGDLFSLIMIQKNKSFIQVLNDVKDILKIGNISKRKKNADVFGGIFNKVSRVASHTEEIETYPDNTLNSYESGWNIRFYNDGISIKVQKEFKIGYDLETFRITVPWFTPNGKLCGIMGRLNIDDIPEDVPKWFPVIPFSKSSVLYGYCENYIYLLENESIFIGESEKFVLQLASMGYRNSVALGGNNISDAQIKYIMNTNPKKIYLCYDEGLDIEVIKKNLIKFKDYLRIKEFDLFLVYDKEGVYIPIGSKASPSDYGKELFDKVIKECVKKINK